MKFSLWLEKRNQKSSTKMPETKSSLERHIHITKKAANEMQHGKAGKIPFKFQTGTRGDKNRKAIDGAGDLS